MDLGKALDVGGVHEILLVCKIDLADHEGVWRSEDAVVGNAVQRIWHPGSGYTPKPYQYSLHPDEKKNKKIKKHIIIKICDKITK